jgi:hypothetical protein
MFDCYYFDEKGNLAHETVPDYAFVMLRSTHPDLTYSYVAESEVVA